LTEEAPAHPQPPYQEPKEQFDIIDLLLFLGLGIPVLLIVMSLSALLLKTAGLQIQGARLLIAQCIGYVALLPLLSFLIRSRHGVSAASLLRFGLSAQQISTSIFLGVFTALSVSAASVLLRTPPLKTPMEELLADTVSLALASVLGVTIVPFFEELLFRGLLQTVLARYLTVFVAIPISALLFALLHGPQYAWSWRHVLLITVAGSAFGIRRLITNSTGAAAIMHGAYNLVLFVALFAGKWAGANLPRAI